MVTISKKMIESTNSLLHDDLEKKLNALRQDRREEIENIWSQIKVETTVVHQVISQEEMDNLLARFHLKKSESKEEENSFDVQTIKNNSIGEHKISISSMELHYDEDIEPGKLIYFNSHLEEEVIIQKDGKNYAKGKILYTKDGPAVKIVSKLED